MFLFLHLGFSILKAAYLNQLVKGIVSFKAKIYGFCDVYQFELLLKLCTTFCQFLQLFCVLSTTFYQLLITFTSLTIVTVFTAMKIGKSMKMINAGHQQFRHGQGILTDGEGSVRLTSVYLFSLGACTIKNITDPQCMDSLVSYYVRLSEPEDASLLRNLSFSRKLQIRNV